MDMSGFKTTCAAAIATRVPVKGGVPNPENSAIVAILNKVEGDIQSAMPAINSLPPSQANALVTLIGSIVHAANVQLNPFADKVDLTPVAEPVVSLAKPVDSFVEPESTHLLDAPVLRYAPPGGITIAGVYYNAGTFITDDVFAKATDGEKALLVADPAFVETAFPI